MRDSLLRLIDDLTTKKDAVNDEYSEMYCWVPDERHGLTKAYEYVIQELEKVVDDHADSNDL
ncbi:hypothetical protein [Paenibacillus sp. Soil724D2]|uniref:hypothetical protein n=1 Tax=Paenibacillus sp. (strain Soil724D2) TaxID=1736392 RepID=UPI0007156B8B|nr:hypothetical protein [Paenibacillus sp. Soil724D2]KRE33275.1 hypothetical protein ASG85_13420 [Paenibacillus sp. Soil724D2]